MTHFLLFVQTSPRKWAGIKGKSDAEGFCGPVEELPELIAACGGKESVLSAIVNQEFQPNQILQVSSHQKKLFGKNSIHQF